MSLRDVGMHWEAISNRPVTQLKKTATIEGIASSTWIEGATLTDLEVESLLASLEIQEFQTRDEQEVAGTLLGLIEGGHQIP